VLPELWLCGYRTATLGADTRAAAEPIDGPAQRHLAAARTTGMVLCAGNFPELDGRQLFNTAVVYGPAGDLLLRHRKTCLYGSEPAVFRPGDAITASDIAGIGRVGLCICFDGDFPETGAPCATRAPASCCTPRRGRRPPKAGGTPLPGSGAVQRSVVDRRRRVEPAPLAGSTPALPATVR
jgi:predicted amidohydrolase